jgi:hypothetical protein
MTKSDEAEKRLRGIEAALAASPRHSDERAMLAFAVVDAEREYHAALRAEKAPRVSCMHCGRKFKPDEPMVWLWHRVPYGFSSVRVCLRCDRSEHEGKQHAD